MYIDKYRDTVKLVQSVLRTVNVTQADRVGRIYHHAFEARLLSDQDFFEGINWYACKVINIASRYSLMFSRKMDIEQVRFWNSVIIAVTPLLGDKPWYEVSKMSKDIDLALTMDNIASLGKYKIKVPKS